MRRMCDDHDYQACLNDTPCPRCGTFSDFRGGYQCDECAQPAA
eukprot:SAG11_NODE_39245_length_237_cov_68.471014_1_plen_42_part_01